MNGKTCSILKRVVEWWKRSGERSYPWRKRSDLYGVLIAEILLTRTPREAVAQVYDEIMKRYPTPIDMAKADEEELSSLFSNLGLYKRGSFLKSLADFLSKRREVSDWRELAENVKGVGRYIARATFAIARNKPLVALDSPTRRLLSRVFGRRILKGSQKAFEIEEELTECSRRLGLGREALLSLVDLADEKCKPSDPLCGSCPLLGICEYSKSIESIHEND